MKSHWPISVLSSFSALVNMLLPLVLVRLLTPDEIGRFKIFFLYLMIFPAFALMLGVTNGLSYWAGRGEKGRVLIRHSGRIILAAGAAATMAALAFRGSLAGWLNWNVGETSVFCLALFAAICSTFFEDSAIALGQVWKGALFSSGWDLARTASILIVAILTHSLEAIFIAHTATLLIKTVVGYALSRRLLAGGAPVPHPAREILRYALPVSAANVFGVFVGYSDQMLLSKFISARDFAFYAVGCLSVPPLTILEFSVTRVLIPQLSAAFDLGDENRAARLYAKAIEELGFLLIPAVAGMFIFAAPIIHLLFTDKFLGAEAYLRAYAFTYLVLMVPYDSVPRARGEAKWIFWNFLSFSIVSLALCYLLLQQFGPFGALAGGLAAKFGMRLYGLDYVRRSTRWRIADFIPEAALLRFTGAAVFLGFLANATQGAFASPVQWFLIAGPLFAVFYFLICGLWSAWAFKRGPQKKNVLMLTQFLGVGGLERMILNLSEALVAQSEWRPRVIVFDHARDATPESHLGPSFERAGIPVSFFHKPAGFSPKIVFRIVRQILVEDVSVVHTHDLGALIYGVCAKLATFGRVRVVHTQHSFVHLGRARRYQLYERFFARLADRIAVVSDDTRETYRKLGLDTGKISVIKNGVRFPSEAPITPAQKAEARTAALKSVGSSRDPSLSERLRQSAQQNWILYMARVHGRKGQDRAIAVWSALEPAVRARSVLLFVGAETERGQEEKLRKLVAEAPDPERVLILGPSHTPELWLRAADLSLSCSEFEGLPLGPIEAASGGLPLVISEIPGHESLGFCSRQFSLAQPEAAARAIEEELSRLAQPGRDYRAELWAKTHPVREQYSLAKMAAAYSALYPHSA